MKISPFPLKREELFSQIARFQENNRLPTTQENFKLALSCIDLTSLNQTDTVSLISVFTQHVNSFKSRFPELPHVAAICVYPNMVSVVKENLAIDGVKIAAVAGNFPSSMTFPGIKIEEAHKAVINGADEIDIVLPLWAFLEGDLEYCRNEVEMIKKAIGEAHIKVIIESGVLADPEKIWQASLLSLEAGADFIKTSTGKAAVAATPEAAIVMCQALKYWYQTTGQMRGFKPAGGIATSEDAMVYITIVREILGEKWLNDHYFRIGASRLANNLLSDITGQQCAHF